MTRINVIALLSAFLLSLAPAFCSLGGAGRTVSIPQSADGPIAGIVDDPEPVTAY